MTDSHAIRLAKAMSPCCSAPVYTDTEDGHRYCSVCDTKVKPVANSEVSRCSDEAALDRVAYQQGDYTHDPSHRCGCCDRQAAPLRPLLLSNEGWVCVQDDFCRAGTSTARD